MTPLRLKFKKKIFLNVKILKFGMPKKMTPKYQAKLKPLFPQYLFLTILTLKKYHANKYTILSLNRIYQAI